MGNNLEEQRIKEKNEKDELLHYFINECNNIKKKDLESTYISKDHKLRVHYNYHFSGEWYFMSYNVFAHYILREIQFESNTELIEINKQLEKIVLLNFNENHDLKLYNYLIQDDNKNIVFILFKQENNEMNLKEIFDKDVYKFSEKQNWIIFINIILNLKVLEINKIMIGNLIPENILIGQSGDLVQFIGYKKIFDSIGLYKKNCPYLLPEKIINNKSSTSESMMWSLGCILFELLIHKQAFSSNIKCEINERCNIEQRIILSKLLWPEKERLTLDELLKEKIIIKKMIEMNYLFRLVKDVLKELGFEQLQYDENIEGN